MHPEGVRKEKKIKQNWGQEEVCVFHQMLLFTKHPKNFLNLFHVPKL
jgi:hypothetical protein